MTHMRRIDLNQSKVEAYASVGKLPKPCVQCITCKTWQPFERKTWEIISIVGPEYNGVFLDKFPTMSEHVVNGVKCRTTLHTLFNGEIKEWVTKKKKLIKGGMTQEILRTTHTGEFTVQVI